MPAANPNRAFENLVASLEGDILSRRIKPGQRLPSERKLNETHGVGRGTVREALRAIEQKGLLEIRKGAKGGAYVKEVDTEQVGDTLATLISHRRVTLESLHEFRQAFEVEAAAWAAARASAADIAALQKRVAALQRVFDSSETDYADFFHHEMKLHRALAQLSDNPLFEWVAATLSINMGYNRYRLDWDRSSAAFALEDWGDIVRALAKRETASVRHIVTSHLITFKRIMEKKLAGKGKNLPEERERVTEIDR